MRWYIVASAGLVACEAFAPAPLLASRRGTVLSRSASLAPLRGVRPRPAPIRKARVTMANSAAGGEVDSMRIATYFGATGAEVLFITAAMAGSSGEIREVEERVEGARGARKRGSRESSSVERLVCRALDTQKRKEYC